MLVKSDPFAGGKCSKFRCLPCKADVKDSKCSKRNILYESTCKSCLKDGKEVVYVGESCRSAYERALEHDNGYRDRKDDNHMWKHANDQHAGAMDVEWEFKVVKVFQKALMRQLSEAVRIKKRGDVLNEKEVYNRCAVPELAVVQNEKICKAEKEKFRKDVGAAEDQAGIEYEAMTSKRDTARKRKTQAETENHPEPVWGEKGEKETEYMKKRIFLKAGRKNTTNPYGKTKQQKLTHMTSGGLVVREIVVELAN